MFQNYRALVMLTAHRSYFNSINKTTRNLSTTISRQIQFFGSHHDSSTQTNEIHTNKSEVPPIEEKSNGTLEADEVEKFRKMSKDWWNPDSQLNTLHSMNKLRVPFIRDGLLSTLQVNQAARDGPKPLKGLRILDVGCGGGVLAEPLARLGADVTGLDAAEEGIEAAKLHAHKDPRLRDSLAYECSTIEEHTAALNYPYDAVIASEVLEHVSSIDLFLESCCAAVKPGGSVFITTINKTPLSYLGAIVMAEYALGLLPRGTHDWNKFVSPQQLKEKLSQMGFHTRQVHGMFYTPLANRWCWVRDTGINYALHAVKTPGTHL